MKLLLDTNVLIPLEPTPTSGLHPTTALAAELARLANLGGHTLYLHPTVHIDLRRDRASQRRSELNTLAQKYPELPSPPPVTPDMEAIIGMAQLGSNDSVDHALLAALRADAVDILVTEDRRLRSKAQRLSLSPRVVTVAEAIALLRDLFDVSPPPPPKVEATLAHALDSHESIFSSFRLDYPGFDQWLAKCRKEHRKAWIIRSESGTLAALAIVKQEQDGEFGLAGKLLKLCSFKVSKQFSGNRYGELLLKPIFDYARENSFSWIYLTVFDKHEVLINLLQEFGFREREQRSTLGELVLAKPSSFSEEDLPTLTPLQFNIRYGPYAVVYRNIPTFVVPIQPPFARTLFPESDPQRPLLPTAPSGNAIRKAYLSHSQTRSLGEGSLLLFYRSGDWHSLVAVGVCESVIRSNSVDEIARYVGTRTVYTFGEIQSLCSTREVLAILFRQARIVTPPVPLAELTRSGSLTSAPQTITRIRKELEPWLQKKLVA